MGKTIQIISLLVSKPIEKTNLIVTPTVAMLQWFSELNTRTTKDSFKIVIYHGPNKTTSKDELMDADIILTTYAILESSFRKQQSGFKRKGLTVKERSLIHSIHFGRVILDEAHSIKDRTCSTARAVFALQTDIKWSLSGTPLQNRVGELYSLIRFMDIDPFSYYFCKACPCKLHTWTFSNRFHCGKPSSCSIPV